MRNVLLVLLLLVVPVSAQGPSPSQPKCLIVSLMALSVSPAFDVLIGGVAIEKADFDYIESVGWKPDLKVFGPDDLRRIHASHIRVVIVPVTKSREQMAMARSACQVVAP